MRGSPPTKSGERSSSAVVSGGGVVKWQRLFPGVQRRGVGLQPCCVPEMPLIGREDGPMACALTSQPTVSLLARWTMLAQNYHGFISNSYGWLGYYFIV